jgi:DNA-binding CsgD family transcriptional regulator
MQTDSGEDAARDTLLEGLGMASSVKDPLVTVYACRFVTVIVGELLEPERAARLFGIVEALEARLGERFLAVSDVAFSDPRVRETIRRVADRARRALGEPAFEQALEGGRAVPFERAADEMRALVEEAEAGPAARVREPGVLSPREREVLALVAQGRSNKEIAEALFIAPTTAKYHVTSLLNKLGADTRARLIALAAERGLL